MNLLLVLSLAIATWVLLEANMTFLAFITIIALVASLASNFTNKQRDQATHAMHSGHAAHARARGERTHRYTIKDPWVQTKTIEDRFEGMGLAFFWPLKQIVGFMRRHGR